MEFLVEEAGEIPSTMDMAKERATAGAPDGTTIVATTMSSGRGQHGNSWHAPPGGWYASIVVRDIADPRVLTLALGNAVSDVLEIAGADPKIKWVNDVFVEDKKIAGILCEAESTGDNVDFIVAGIGINLNGTTSNWPDGLADSATTLESVLGVDTCLPDAQPYVLEAIGKWIDKVKDGKRDDVIASFRERDYLAGREVEIDGVRGSADGVDDDGRLLVAGKAMTSGPVSIVN